MRIQVNLGNALQEKVDKFSEMCGVTRSSFCAMLISQGVLAYEKSFEVMDSMKEPLQEAFSDMIKNKS